MRRGRYLGNREGSVYWNWDFFGFFWEGVVVVVVVVLFSCFTIRFPGFLDNTVAGGIPSGMPVFESLVKECMEEASLGADMVQKHVRGAGAISYFFRWNFEFRLLGHSLTFPKDLEGLATT